MTWSFGFWFSAKIFICFWFFAAVPVKLSRYLIVVLSRLLLYGATFYALLQRKIVFSHFYDNFSAFCNILFGVFARILFTCQFFDVVFDDFWFFDHFIVKEISVAHFACEFYCTFYAVFFTAVSIFFDAVYQRKIILHHFLRWLWIWL